MPLWWNWQTRGIQNPFFARKYRFESDQWQLNIYRDKNMNKYKLYGIGNALLDYEYKVNDSVLEKLKLEKGCMLLNEYCLLYTSPSPRDS